MTMIQISPEMVWQVAEDDDTGFVSSSVSQSVSQRGGDELTDEPLGVGEGSSYAVMAMARAVLPALIGQVVDRPITTIEPLEQYGRVVVARVVPQATVDPVLPLILRPQSRGYVFWYQRYWRGLMRFLNAAEVPGLQRRMRSLQRRLVMQLPREGLSPREMAFFMTWLSHGKLGDYELRLSNGKMA